MCNIYICLCIYMDVCIYIYTNSSIYMYMYCVLYLLQLWSVALYLCFPSSHPRILDLLVTVTRKVRICTAAPGRGAQSTCRARGSWGVLPVTVRRTSALLAAPQASPSVPRAAFAVFQLRALWLNSASAVAGRRMATSVVCDVCGRAPGNDLLLNISICIPLVHAMPRGVRQSKSLLACSLPL